MADKSKNTGTGGINIDGKVHTMDVGVPEAQVDNTKDYSSGDIAVDKTVKDISRPTRETFAKYLSKTTLGTVGASTHKNVYPVGAGAQTQVEEIKLKDTQGNPVSPGPQNNEAKFAAGFNQTISSNNPAGIKKGLATGSGPDGNVLLPGASTAAPSGGNYVKFVTSNADNTTGLQQPIKKYTGDVVGPNLYDYDSDKVGIADGTLNASPTQVRDIKVLPASSDVGTDGGTSKNILGTDDADGNYTLTAIEAQALAGATTAKNKFPIDSVPTIVTFRDASGNPVSVTAAQNNVTNTKFFTKLIEEKKEGDQTVQTISVRELSSYTDALTSAESSADSKFIIKRGKTEKINGIDGNDLLLTIAPKTAGVASLTTGAKKYTDNVVEPNLYDYNTSTVGLSAGSIGESPTNPRENLKYIPADSSISVDGGKSINILGPDAPATPDYTLTLIDRASYAETITKTNFFKVDAPTVAADVLSTTKIVLSTPLSATDAQNNPFASSFFTKEIQTINNVSKVVSKLESSYTDALAASRADSLGDTDKFIIKRGKTENANGIDGNALLSTIAPKIGDKVTLTPGAQTYITAVLKPNLNDIYDPKTESGVVIPEYENDGAPSGIKDLNKTHTFAADAGTSKNILGDLGARRLKLLETATQASKVTIGNFFKVDLPNTEKVGQTDILITKKLTGITPDSVTDAQNHPFNSSFFTKDKTFESSYSNTFIAASQINNQNPLAQFSIKRGKVGGVGETGNELLPLATIPAIVSDRHIKFTALNANVSNYTTVLLKKNLYSINNKIEIGNLQNSDFFGLPRLHKPESGPNDAGTFDNIQKDPSKRAITKDSLFQHLVDEVAGKNAPGNIGNVYKLSNLSSAYLFSFTTPEGVPESPTAAQDNLVSFDQYVLPAGVAEADDVKLQSSYSNATEKLEIRRGKSIQDGRPDGNTLLKDAAAVADAGPYIKKSGDVSPTISKYVGAVLEENRYSPEDREQFVPSDTPGAEGYTQDGADPSPGGQRFENISDKGAPETSFVGRTTLYAPSQLKFGESPQSMVNRGVSLTGYTFRRLTRIGTILQLRAAGEIVSITGAENDDPRSNVEQLAALLPGAGQAGAGIPLSRELLNVTEIIKNLPDESISAGISTITQYEGELIDINTTFEGIVNTALEKFSGFSSLGLLVLAIAIVAVIIVAIWGILGNLLASSSALDRTEKHPGGIAGSTSSGIHGLGSFQGRGMTGGTNFIADLVKAVTQVPSSGAVSLFGISPTYNREYSDAVYRGALAFFGLGASPPPLLAYPGQVLVTARAIVRGVSRLALAFSDIVTAFTTGNVFSAIFKLIDIIEVIRNSKVIKALNTFSQIGDRRPFTVLGGLYIKNLPPGEDPANPSPGGAPTQGSISQSKTTGLFGGKELFQQDANDEYDIGVKISEIDSVVDAADKHKMTAAISPGAPPNAQLVGKKFINKDYIGLSQVKSRLQGTTALAWSTYRAPSLFVTTKNLSFDPGDGSKPNFNINNDHAATYSNEGPRIDSTAVRAFEDALDGEYMPFYFQDLRTNEIIGLHAFLLSLTDDYSANYESISGIGRAEPVRIYKDTQRKIGFSFMLAALDKNDFNHMWDKVNRLTMLAYPQYTRGKIYNNSSLGIQFEKPFTQQVAAAPMVRLRLGNLFRSNYSKFNLAKIFGIGGDGTKVNLTQEDKQTQVAAAKKAADARGAALVAQATAAAIKEIKDSDKTIKYSKDYEFKLSKATVYKTSLDAKTAARVGVESAQPPAQQALKFQAPLQAPKTARFVDGGDWYRTFKDDAATPLRFKISEVFPPTAPEFAKGKFVVISTAPDADKTSLPSPGGKEFFVPIADLTMDDATNTKYDAAIAKEAEKNPQVETAKKNAPQPTSSNETIAASEQEFMLAANNVIVRSFESTGGKGLAGFIDSINFDWYDRTTWDIDIERKAPQMCKVTISFTPIHDIAPGLDAYGNNRAPIYPLGPYAYGTRKQAGSK